VGQRAAATATGGVKRGEIPDPDSGYGRAWKFNHKVFFLDGRRRRNGCARKEAASGDRTGTKTTAPASTRRTTTISTCRACATTAPTRPARTPARAARLKSASEDGIVLVNQDRCHGYRFCVEACPYKKCIFDPKRQVSTKCIFCLPRVEEGVAPACARQCPGRLRFVGYLDDPHGPIWKLVHKWKVAIPLHPEFGTGPNVFYVPPMSPPKLDAPTAAHRRTAHSAGLP
jgi:Fe-S-cluster-containing dehydrogenase component